MGYIVNYFELGWYDQLASAIDAYKHFINENKNMPEHRISWANNSLRFITKITNAKSGNKKLDYADFKEAETSQNYISRKWIMDIMKELL